MTRRAIDPRLPDARFRAAEGLSPLLAAMHGDDTCCDCMGSLDRREQMADGLQGVGWLTQWRDRLLSAWRLP